MWKAGISEELQSSCLILSGLQIEVVLAYFMHLKCPKRIGDDVGDLKYVFPN
jgi:heme/copper-type cytochrome/quinol oxidase subunit 4